MKTGGQSRSRGFPHWVLFLVGLIVLALYVVGVESNWRSTLVEQAEHHARVVSPTVWNLDPRLSTDYLELAAVAAGYESIEVRTMREEVFYRVEGPEIQGWEKMAESLGLLPRVRLEVPIEREGIQIGRLKVVAISRTIHGELMVFLALLLGIFLVERSLRVIEGKRTLEERVAQRTRQLGESEANLRQLVRLLDLSPNVIFVREANGVISYFNAGAKIWWNESELLDKLETVYQATRDRDEQNTLTREKIWEGDVTLKSGKGEALVLHASVALSAPENTNAQTGRVLFIGTDVTERKELESRLLRVQRTQALGTLASGVAHDFNNLLTPILLSVQLLQTQSRIDPQAARSYETIAQCARRGADLVRQLLNIAGNRQVARSNVDLAGLLKEIEKLMRSTFPKRIDLEFDWPSNLPFLRGDQTNLHQAILNLCVNARDSMSKEGKLRLTAKMVNGPLAMVGMDHIPAGVRQWVVITVEDTGTGISKEIQPKIFDPFFTTKDSAQGTGLGLSTVQGIVHSHGGVVEVSSAPDQGSTFRILLPVVSLHAATLAEEKVSSFEQQQGELLMIVDDEKMILETTSELLKSVGFRVVTASSGAAALQWQAENAEPVRVLISDLMMPKMNGLEMVDAFRQRQPDVPVVIVTGLLNSKNKARIAERGITLVLPKPFGLEELRKYVRQALDQSSVESSSEY